MMRRDAPSRPRRSARWTAFDAVQPASPAEIVHVDRARPSDDQSVKTRSSTSFSRTS